MDTQDRDRGTYVPGAEGARRLNLSIPVKGNRFRDVLETSRRNPQITVLAIIAVALTGRNLVTL